MVTGQQCFLPLCDGVGNHGNNGNQIIMNNINNDEIYGIFIDGDNMNPKYYSKIDDMIRQRGRIIMKNVYGDFSEENLKGWKKVCIEYGVQAIMAWRTKSKNSSDMKMVTDLMDILQKVSVITHFVIVTGDIDFKEICRIIISYNKKVIGISCFESSTSSALQCFCSEFIILDKIYELKPFTLTASKSLNLKGEDNTGYNMNNMNNMNNPHSKESSPTAEPLPVIIATIQEICSSWNVNVMNLGLLKRRLLNINPCFNESNYGHRYFKDFIRMCEPDIFLDKDERGDYIIRVHSLTSPATSPPPTMK